ncbi:DNA-binding FadR family transcriptional regulator [Motilibacter rhizosphaerae]|uniref:DNA-binding FadR family transcriptional regulator n=1 Tax=Motilibacter rhizosphaerae TaxID=598652 RepID=A0A4Q7NWU0_9ACTN|nr:FCD domain-containing protein [Motilibacter rhizosphaerae]RZS91664.1 DNA-binding FadR family transcriptional regulator [Motilibacter rhizosphaerae]
MADPAPALPPALLPRGRGPRPARRADAVLDGLLEQIVAGELAPGSPVPTEPMLVEAYGVSRTVVREAVKLLEQKGLVTARQGIGTLVSPQDHWNLLDTEVLAAIVRHDEEYEVLDQLISVRTALESQMAADAARLATEEDLRELSELMRELDGLVRTPERMDDVDVAFHERIMLASGNQLGRAIVRTVHAEARRSQRYSGHSTPSLRRQSNRQHQAILAAIAAGEAERAAELMTQHITESWKRRRPGDAARRTC